MAIAKKPHSNQSGFTLVETMFAIIIMGGGLLALACAFSQGMILMATGHYQQIAKEKAAEAIESVTSARDTKVFPWAQICNVSNGGIFLDGAQPLRTPGADGMVGTGDDGAVETETLPGPDGILGTADDKVVTLAAFTRQIQITDIEPNLRQVVVTIRYTVGRIARTYQLTTYISAFA
jgi:prepilin-type N-terminal cleavage/methylation domain-containing protein